MPRLDPNLCIVCMKKRKKPQFNYLTHTINICSEECYEEYKDVLNEMSESCSDKMKGDEECSLKAEE